MGRIKVEYVYTAAFLPGDIVVCVDKKKRRNRELDELDEGAEYEVRYSEQGRVTLVGKVFQNYTYYTDRFKLVRRRYGFLGSSVG